MTKLLLAALLLVALFVAMPAFAQAAPAAPVDNGGALSRAMGQISGDGRSLSLSLQILILMSLLTVLPSLILMMTSFTRIIIVLSLLRQALGLRSEEHTSELQSLMRISYAGFCLKKKIEVRIIQ